MIRHDNPSPPAFVRVSPTKLRPRPQIRRVDSNRRRCRPTIRRPTWITIRERPVRPSIRHVRRRLIIRRAVDITRSHEARPPKPHAKLSRHDPIRRHRAPIRRTGIGREDRVSLRHAVSCETITHPICAGRAQIVAHAVGRRIGRRLGTRLPRHRPDHHGQTQQGRQRSEHLSWSHCPPPKSSWFQGSSASGRPRPQLQSYHAIRSGGTGHRPEIVISTGDIRPRTRPWCYAWCGWILETILASQTSYF